jgi:AraC family transcriptional regulator of adaptative response / DNA-3-methyladenine glycosylase II
VIRLSSVGDGVGPKVCDRARRSRDARFDGKFFIAVTSTRIYCRPICPARSPKDENVRYYRTAAAAQADGFRPCLRCRPEASPATPAWAGTSSVVSRGLRLISEGALDREGVEALADRLGVTARHLRRLFVQHLGATPSKSHWTRRVHFAKKLIDETRLPISQIAFAAGFGATSANGEIRKTFSRTPTELRKLAQAIGRLRRVSLPPVPPAALRLAAGNWLLAARATPRIETVDANRYQRTIAIGDTVGTIAIGPLTRLGVDARCLHRRSARCWRSSSASGGCSISAPIRRSSLNSCRATFSLRRAAAAHAGIRTPGAWDAFEITVRAILGQQISVKAATTIAGRIAHRWGKPLESGDSPLPTAHAPLNRLFPTPDQLADAPLEEAGITSSRARTLRLLARAVRDGDIVFNGVSTLESLRAIPGIGEWTAQ